MIILVSSYYAERVYGVAIEFPIGSEALITEETATCCREIPS